MAQRTTVLLVDDIDGRMLKEGQGETVTFALDDTPYGIDLSTKERGQVPCPVPRLHCSWTQDQRRP